MKKYFSILLALLAAAFAVSCTKPVDPVIPDPVLTVSVETVTVPAEAQEVSEAITVTANRSWRATVESDGDWAYISGTRSYTAEDNETVETRLVLKFEDNMTFAEREGTLTIKGDELETVTVKLVQAGKENTNTLTTTSEAEYKDIAYTGGRVDVSIKSNTTWIASLSDGAPAGFKILNADEQTGKLTVFGDSDVTVSIAANNSSSAVSATLTVVDADGLCTPLVFTISQKGAPALHLISGKSPEFPVPSYGGYQRKIYFSSTENWTASVSGAASVTPTSGNASEETFVTVTFPENTGAADRISTVTISTANDKVDVNVKQSRPADYKVFFRVYPSDAYSKDSQYRTWLGNVVADGTYGLFAEKLVNNAFGTFTLTQVNSAISSERIKIGFISNNPTTPGNFSNDYTGHLMGSTSKDGGDPGCHIVFPAIAGKRLARVECYGGGITDNQIIVGSIRDGSGNVIAGGDDLRMDKNALCISAGSQSGKVTIQSVQEELTKSPESYACWELPETTANTEYNLYFKQRACVRWFCIWYE